MNSLNGQEFGKTTVGIATIPFTDFECEDSVSVVGQVGMLATAVILCSVIAGNDDIIAQDWFAPIITNVVANTGFKISLKPHDGDFKGPVTLNWSWRNV